MNNDQQSQRQACRQARNSLSKHQQAHHSKLATQRFLETDFFLKANKIAVFLSRDGELSTQELIQLLWQYNKKVYLPVILKNNRMQFAAYQPNTKLTLSKFKTLEPSTPDFINTEALDLIIMPLTCFDKKGNRIGMGGGYYDKTLAFKANSMTTNPKLLGWAHQCQQITSIQSCDWDIPLNALMTEEYLYQFSQ